MMIPANQIDKYFPELAEMPLKQQQEIVEMARYQVYMKGGGRKKFVRPYIMFGLLGLVVTILLTTVVTQFFAIEPTFLIYSGVGASVVIPFYFQQMHWIQQMRPKVLELMERFTLVTTADQNPPPPHSTPDVPDKLE